MAIPIKLQAFEGPMDLLMHLIEKNKIDIYDIPIAAITDQYLDYVRQMKHEDMNVASEFLVMAATLLDIKSRMLLPKDEKAEEDEGDPRDELVQRLLEYKMYKYMSEELRERSRRTGISYYRQQDLPREVLAYVPPINYEELIGDRTALTLQSIFEDVMRRRKSRIDPVRSGFGEIHREVISAADKELFIRAYLEKHPHADFRELLESQHSKDEVIVTFLVILELMKSQKIRITQDRAFGRIAIDVCQEDTAEPETGTFIQEDMESYEPDAADPGQEEWETGGRTEEFHTVPLAANKCCLTREIAAVTSEEKRSTISHGQRYFFNSRLGRTNAIKPRRSADRTAIRREITMAERRLGMRGALAYSKAVQIQRSRRIWHRKRRIYGVSAQ